MAYLFLKVLKAFI